MTARTPLLIGGYQREGEDGNPVPDVPRRPDATPIVPGSGFLGAVRSLHEAFAGGCLRVLDTDWVAVHRHPASGEETNGLRLAVVLKVDDQGSATQVGLCDQVVWIDQRILPREDDRTPQTGDRLTVAADKAFELGNRRILRPADVEPGDVAWLAGMSAGLDESWVLLATDTRARAAGKPVYFAAGRLGRDTPRLAVPAATWATYHRTVDGADDLRTAVLPPGGEPDWGSCQPEYVGVFWPLPEPGEPPAGSPVARRLAARHYLHRGQPVWVKTDGQQVTEIRLSRLWRYEGSHTVGERAGGAVPCTDPDSLCWSCRVFGSADTSGRRADDIARQRSYRGHVRVDYLVAAVPFEPVGWHLAPLAAPKPSAGQFYLDNSVARRREAAKDTRPAATWGSCADDGRVRPIRGRKLYWRTAAPDQGTHPRGRCRDHADTQIRDAALVPAGTVFNGRVTFENLSTEDFGSLLVALDPRRMAAAGAEGWGSAVSSVGGGKPFGFGAVTVDVTVDRVQTAAGRYLGEDGEVPGIADAVRAFLARVPRRVTGTWPALRHALQLGFVPDDLVWYPPGKTGSKGDAEFDRSFEFFSRTTGVAFMDKVRELVDLPDAGRRAEDQVLDSAKGERAVDAGSPPAGGPQ